MPNPGTVSQGDIDKLEQGMKDLTSLGQQLSKTFRDINRETDVLGNNFKSLITSAQSNNDLASKYLISQKLQEATQNRINEIKAKTSYLDSVGLEFKREETKLQSAIASAQIKALESSISMDNINKAERERATNEAKNERKIREDSTKMSAVKSELLKQGASPEILETVIKLVDLNKIKYNDEYKTVLGADDEARILKEKLPKLFGTNGPEVSHQQPNNNSFDFPDNIEDIAKLPADKKTKENIKEIGKKFGVNFY
jgi:hypothetical protein